jgi:hypothetical protein
MHAEPGLHGRTLCVSFGDLPCVLLIYFPVRPNENRSEYCGAAVDLSQRRFDIAAHTLLQQQSCSAAKSAKKGDLVHI